jgi:hypothetical protein
MSSFELVPRDTFAALMQIETVTEKYPGAGDSLARLHFFDVRLTG